ncbi:Chemotaxis protein histidine kinase-like protein [Hyella patelloides LEGE 07179]|uniref:histidine kinase n=1 Tax=Hyella patelloides LEGE 07179 TaxID=945734 RepID=A0A563VTS7_9CYAN|nr:hybrid sensor histidine kinase/response regulator [Hyella patelloides]VEP14779.1 Chemotaxis protein histidine kinase-like protein [Hyella patelloides LEGE 07179]
MSLNPDIRDQAYQFFIEEAQELLQVLEDGLLNLKEDHSTSKVHELMRAAHSIKGGAASVELDTIKLIAHRLEDFFKALYSEKVEFDANLEGLFLQAYDCLKEPLTEQMEMGSFDEEAALVSVEPVFNELEELLGDALKEADSYIPSATDLGVDIVASIFEIDVQQSLEHLSTVVNNPEQFDAETQLKEQLDILGGFAELFPLPGFSEIITLGRQAIANTPEKALEITQVFISDCEKAREVILAGDRERGGEPSAALIAIAKGKLSEPARENHQILDALNAASEEKSSEVAEPAKGLEDLFGGNIFDIQSIDPPQEKSEFRTIDELFGNAFSASDSENPQPANDVASSTKEESETPPEEILDDENIFDFALEDRDSAVIIDWGNIPSEDSTAKLPITDEEKEGIDYQEIEDANANGAFDFNIIELGSKIINGENVEDLPASQFADTENFDTAVEFFKDSQVETPQSELTSTEYLEQPESVVEEPKEISKPEFATPENLDTALNSIGEIFAQLPPAITQEIIPETLATPAKSERKKAKKAKSKSQASVGNQLSVRVDLERLERMNNLIGELVINRNSLSLQNEQLQFNVKDLSQKFNRFRTVTSKLRELSDRMLVESEHSQSKVASSETAEFDSLEMDSYNHIQLLLQDILEEILQLEEGVDDIFLFAQQSDRTINQQRQMLGRMRDELMWARMLPLEQILKRFPRTLRDLSNEYKKPVNLNLIGTGVLVDKAVLEKLYDPLLHLLRNGFDHGIEALEIRRQQGKPEQGQIEIHAYYQGNQTIIEVRDDGKGLDTQKIAEKAIKKGIISATEAANSPQENLFNLIFEPGFSTAEKVSEISGRGVGMSVVREQIESLKGTIAVNSTPGKGSTFTLSLPLTLTIAKLLVCSLGETAFAFPSDSIEEIIIPLPDQIKLSNNKRFLYWNQELISIYNIQEILEYNCSIIPIDTNSKVFESVNAPQDWALPLLLLRRGRQFFALEIDRLITEQELVIKPFGKTLTAPNYTYGCTILGDGTLIPVLNGVILISQFLGETINYQPVIQPIINQSDNLDVEANLIITESTTEDNNLTDKVETKIQTVKQPIIMVVDDSTALRRTMALSLERQGYRILQAKDGRDAIEQLRKTSGVDLIVCDIEMPHMNGFEFLGVRRRDSEIKDIPVIMLTSRSGIKHRNLANQLGANGYFTKPYVEQEFLRELNTILDGKSVKNSDRNKKHHHIDRKHKVLIVDDSSALRRTMCLALKTKGYRVLEARDGEEGLEQMYQNTDISLVICDIEMPKMNGFELLTSRRQDPQLQKIPVAMLTSRSNQKHQNLANQLGANAYFTKPYTENDFIVEIEKLIKNNLLKT